MIASSSFQIGDSTGDKVVAGDQQQQSLAISPLRAQQLVDARRNIGLGVVLECSEAGELFITRLVVRILEKRKFIKNL